MKEQWKVILLIVALIFVVVFALQNTSNVAIDLLITSFQVPLVLVILFSLLIGVIIGLLSSMAAIQANRKDNNKLKKEMETLKADHRGEINEKNDKIRQLHEDLEDQKHVATYQAPSQRTDENLGVFEKESDDINDSFESQDFEENIVSEPEKKPAIHPENQEIAENDDEDTIVSLETDQTEGE